MVKMDYILKIFKSKVGISLFLSWVLLILITVSIGTTVYLWAKTFSQEKSNDLLVGSSEQVGCSSVSVGILNACQNSNTLLLDLRNQKDLKIKGFLISLVYLYNNVDNIEINKSLGVYEETRLKIPKRGVVKKIVILPKILVGDNIIVCSQNKIEKEGIKYC